MFTHSEASLVRRLRDSATRHEAFEELVGRYSETLYLQIRRMVLSHDDADDILQNTFLKAWLAVDYFRGDAKLSTWLYRIAINECLTFLQKAKLTVPIDDLATPPEASPDGGLTAADSERANRLFKAAIASLPDKQRIVFNLKYFDEMKYEDMSELLHTSVGALKASYHFAVKKIEDFFNSHD